MTTSTPINFLPKPEATDPPNAPSQIGALADQLDNKLVPRFVSAASRNATITSPTDGQVAYIGDARALSLYRSDVADWVNLPTYQTGQRLTSGSGNSFSVTVTFPKPFPATPKVLLNVTSGDASTARWGVRAISISTTGFTIFAFYSADATTSTTWSNIPVDWVAIL